ncbi:MAG: hypothetical protein U0V70_17805 [Terriglobia bacterium]
MRKPIWMLLLEEPAVFDDSGRFGQASVPHLWNWLMPTLFGLHP